MIITNKHGLPAPIVNALSERRPPKLGRYSVTDLVGNPLVRVLKMLHWAILEQDASEMLWMLMGLAIHSVLEGNAEPQALVEEKMELPIAGGIVVGKTDYYENEEISDWKITSVYSFLLGDKIEWDHQLQIYRVLYHYQGFNTLRLLIHAILRDWQKSKGLYDPQYPSIPFHTVKIPMWPLEEAEQYLADRVMLHRAAEITTEPLPICSDEERWASPTKYALKKVGAKRATKLYDTEFEAESAMTKGYEIELRQGEYRKCKDYCAVRAVCQHNPYKETA